MTSCLAGSTRAIAFVAAACSALFWTDPTLASDRISGRVLGGGAPIAGSTVTLLSASTALPRQLATTTTQADGTFTFAPQEAVPEGSSLYVVATGGKLEGKAENKAITLITALGATAPGDITVNEMTTIATVWTHNQLIAGKSISGQPLQLKIAADNVPNFVNLETGGWGSAIQDPLNSGQTPTMANFATLADVLAGCVTNVVPGACEALFEATEPPIGSPPTDTLSAAQSVAKFMWYKPERVFKLLDVLYPVPEGQPMRAVPYMPYLNYPAKCLGAAAQVRWWWLPGGRKGDVRQ